jgi:hypothetical protein
MMIHIHFHSHVVIEIHHPRARSAKGPPAPRAPVPREPMHGYAIVLVIRNRSGEVLKVETGSPYPGLHRLERQKWVKSERKLTESKQRAKFYQLTASGRNSSLLITGAGSSWFVRSVL